MKGSGLLLMCHKESLTLTKSTLFAINVLLAVSSEHFPVLTPRHVFIALISHVSLFLKCIRYIYNLKLNEIMQVTWIEHVEVDHKPDAHWLYRELLCGGSGYGAKRWTTTLERMCERMALSSIRTIPATDWSEGTFHL